MGKIYPIIVKKQPISWQKISKFLKNKHSIIVKNAQLLPAGLGDEHLILDTKHPIFVKNI